MYKKLLLINIIIIFLVLKICGQAVITADADNELYLKEFLSPAGYYTVEEFRKDIKGKVDLVIYDQSNNDTSEYILLLAVNEEENRIKGYNIPFIKEISVSKAEKIAETINGGEIDNYLKFNVLNFVEVVELYEQITIETGSGFINMNKQESLDYLENGKREDKYNRLGRQIKFFEAINDTIRSNNSLFKIPSLLSILNRGYHQTDTNMGRLQAINFGFKFLNYDSEDIIIYFPGPDTF